MFVIIEKGKNYEFDLFIGVDGVWFVVCKMLFLDVSLRLLSGNCVYWVVVLWEEVCSDLLICELVENKDGSVRKIMEVWMVLIGYIILYLILDVKVFNMVFSYFWLIFID